LKPKRRNSKRFAAAFVLAGIDAGVKLLEHLVVAREQGCD